MSIYDYSGCIKLTFDRPIIEDPEVITGIEYVPIKETVTNSMISVASTYGSNYKNYAIDGFTEGGRYESDRNSGNYFQVDFGISKLLGKIRYYQVSGDYVFTGFTLQGSADASSWSDITTGTTTGSTGWHECIFTPASYRYWRVLFTTPAAYYITLYEIEYYSIRTKYLTDGWEVSALEPDKSPGGSVSKKVYLIRKITKSEDGRSVFIWLDLPGRIKYPISNITVKFTGTLVGLGNVNVKPFEVTFAPTSSAKIFNPHNVENLTVNTKAMLSCFEVIYRYSQQGIENIATQASATVVVTKVGSLPI